MCILRRQRFGSRANLPRFYHFDIGKTIFCVLSSRVISSYTCILQVSIVPCTFVVRRYIPYVRDLKGFFFFFLYSYTIVIIRLDDIKPHDNDKI